MDLNLKVLVKGLEDLSIEVGNFIRERRKQTFSIDEKSYNNLVTEVDKKAEEKFVEGLKKLLPNSGFIAEEGTAEKIEGGYNWIIDPIDGTTNFVHNVPLYCTSVALHKDNELLVGVIYEPNGRECFSAAKGLGAFLNGAPIQVSKTKQLSQALIATGFPYDDFERENGYFEVLKKFTHSTRGIRRLGSAAIDLAYVACGRFDAFYEYGLNPWDVAAGILIINEAGGLCTDFKDGDNMIFGEEITATNRLIHNEINGVIASVFQNN